MNFRPTQCPQCAHNVNGEGHMCRLPRRFQRWDSREGKLYTYRKDHVCRRLEHLRGDEKYPKECANFEPLQSNAYGVDMDGHLE